jgi:hypothetical protein
LYSKRGQTKKIYEKLETNQPSNTVYKLIWDNKPHKIKREVLSQNCDMGGLKMLNIKMYIKGLKLSWIRRIIKKDLKIKKLLLSSEKIDITQLLNSGHKPKKNPFWEEVFSLYLAWPCFMLQQSKN